MSATRRFPLLSIRSWRMMGCSRKASGCGGLPFTNPVRSHIRSLSLLSYRSLSHTVLISLISLSSFRTIANTAPCCVSAGGESRAGYVFSGWKARVGSVSGRKATSGVFGVLLRCPPSATLVPPFLARRRLRCPPPHQGPLDVLAVLCVGSSSSQSP